MVGIIILNFNNAEYTINCVESILRFNTFPLRIVIVDNASTDNSRIILDSWLSEHPGAFELISSSENGGYAKGNNLGLKYLDTDEEVTEVMVLNNDIIFTEDIIPKLSHFVRTHSDAGLVSPLLKCSDGVTPDSNCARRDCSFKEIVWTYLLYFTNRFGILSHFSDSRKLILTNPEILEQSQVNIELPSGSCMIVDKQLFRDIGWFDPGTFLYYEENILYRKMLALGKRNYMLPGVSCIHLGGMTTNKMNHNASYMKASKASGFYYAMHYRDLTALQRFVLSAAFHSYNCMVNLVKAVKYCKKFLDRHQA